MYSAEDILKVIEEFSGETNIAIDDDIYEIGLIGDDFEDLMELYASRFNVDMTSYLWYFHTDEEGSPGLGGYFFRPPNERVTRIPVTPRMMLDFANSGKWAIVYPEHTIPKRRWDLTFNLIVFLLTIAAIVAYALFN